MSNKRQKLEPVVEEENTVEEEQVPAEEQPVVENTNNNNRKIYKTKVSKEEQEEINKTLHKLLTKRILADNKQWRRLFFQEIYPLNQEQQRLQNIFLSRVEWCHYTPWSSLTFFRSSVTTTNYKPEKDHRVREYEEQLLNKCEKQKVQLPEHHRQRIITVNLVKTKTTGSLFNYLWKRETFGTNKSLRRTHCNNGQKQW